MSNWDPRPDGHGCPIGMWDPRPDGHELSIGVCGIPDQMDMDVQLGYVGLLNKLIKSRYKSYGYWAFAGVK